MQISSRDGPANQNRPGPVYDTAMRRMFESDPSAACKLLGIPVAEPPAVLSTSFPSATMVPDLVLELIPGRLVHVEYAREASRGLVARMLIYRGLIMREQPGAHLSQHIIVLGDGLITGHDDLQNNGFALVLGLIYVRDLDPDELLENSTLATLAVLARGDPDVRADSLMQAVNVIEDQGGERAGELLEFAGRMAMIRLDSDIVSKILDEAGQQDEFAQLLLGIPKVRARAEALVAADLEAAWIEAHGKGRSEARSEARRQGREEGRREERDQFLTAMLQERFGQQPDLAATAQRLAGWPDPRQAVHTINTAETLADLPAEPSA